MSLGLRVRNIEYIAHYSPINPIAILSKSSKLSPTASCSNLLFFVLLPFYTSASLSLSLHSGAGT